MRVLVTGSRALASHVIVYRELGLAYEEWLANPQRDLEFVVVHGAAPGADTFAGQWVFDRRAEIFPPRVEPHPAEWHKYGASNAGRVRNTEMVQLGADLVLAFFQPGARNVGTRDCVDRAKTFLAWKGVPIKEIWE